MSTAENKMGRPTSKAFAPPFRKQPQRRSSDLPNSIVGFENRALNAIAGLLYHATGYFATSYATHFKGRS
jgi:hypothetical protein